MLFEITLLIICRNDSAFGIWFSFSKLSAHISLDTEIQKSGNKIQKITGNNSLLEPAVLNLRNQEIPQHHLELLNLGPKFDHESRLKILQKFYYANF